VTTVQAPQPQSWAHTAAKVSWWAPLGFVLSGFVLRGKFPFVRDFLGCSAMAIGLTAAIIALIGIPKHGVRGILAPALIGAAVSLLLVLIFASNFLAGISR
jgi:hypothetical protein